MYVCGAVKLKRIAEERNWSPGSFLNDDFTFDNEDYGYMNAIMEKFL